MSPNASERKAGRGDAEQLGQKRKEGRARGYWRAGPEVQAGYWRAGPGSAAWGSSSFSLFVVGGDRRPDAGATGGHSAVSRQPGRFRVLEVDLFTT